MKIGDKKWHRVFGWCIVRTPENQLGKLLVDSEYKYLRHYVVGKGWVTYRGEDGEVIRSIYLHKDELHETPKEDAAQILIKGFVDILE
jgi:hypothetical protein